MNDASGSTHGNPSFAAGRNETGQSGSAGNQRTILRSGLYFCFALVVLGMLSYVRFRSQQDAAAVKESQDRLVAFHGLAPIASKRLSPEYTDKDGDLLADAPRDPKDWLDPDTLVLAHYKDADADTQLVDWDALVARLGEATGKKIVAQEYLNSADDVGALKTGTIHIVALHAADAPYVVNNAGFVPVGVLGSEDGAHGNHLDIAVAAKSNVRDLADVRGHTLTCTTPDSITGYRAAIAVLAQKTGMRPDVDYNIDFSFGQRKSVLGVAAGDFEVAALSDDKLESMLKQGSVEPSAYRLIYESEVVPRLTIGYACNVEPDLAAKVTRAVLDFTNESGPQDESTGKPLRFFASDYKKDFEFVRRIDDSFDPRFHKRPKQVPPPPAPSEMPAEAEDASGEQGAP
jgi:phosphonate transport system substrate-binding protein